MAAPITDGWLVEVNNFSLILPGLFGDEAEQTKVPMIFDTASICFLIRISLGDPARARLDCLLESLGSA